VLLLQAPEKVAPAPRFVDDEAVGGLIDGAPDQNLSIRGELQSQPGIIDLLHRDMSSMANEAAVAAD